jgi:putative SOS response-associated peptidase YedK
MCGRFAQAIPLGRLKMTGLFDEADLDYIESFNVAPSHYAAVVLMKEGRRLLSMKKWGLVPSWSKDDKMGSRLINARGETLKDKPSFRNAFRKRRCIIPVSGFYEWHTEAGVKKPFFIRMRGKGADDPMLIAGLHESWNRPDGEVLETFTIITTDACEKLKVIHDRMPVVILPENINRWLDDSLLPHDIERHIKHVDDDEIEFYPVSEFVNSRRIILQMPGELMTFDKTQ